MTRIFWLLFGMSTVACDVFDNVLPKSPPPSPPVWQGASPERCKAGDELQCQMVAVREVEHWKEDVGAAIKATPEHLTELAQVLASACSSWGSDNTACLDARRVGLEQVLRKLEVVGGNVPDVATRVRAARSRLAGAGYDINVAEAEVKQGIAVVRTVSIRAKVADAKTRLVALHLPHTGGFDEEFFNIENALKRSDLDAADQQADAVLKEVQSVAAAHQQADSQQRAADLGAAKLAQEKARLESQAPAVQAATTACDANPVACKTKCDGGDGPACFAWATKLWKKTNPPNLTDAKAAMQKGCNAQTQAACDALLYIDSDIQTAETNARAVTVKLDELWSPVDTAADEIARHIWLLQWARQNRVATQNHALMAQKITENTRRLFCPAKAAFIAQSTAAEFNKRAAAHCKDNAPVGSSQGNFYAAETSTQVTLTTQCQTVFASQCP